MFFEQETTGNWSSENSATLQICFTTLLAEVVRKHDEDVCFLQTFKKTCPVGQAVHILSAKLGRMEQSDCLSTNDHLGCYDDVSAEMREKCYGQETCEIFVSSLGNLVQSCPNTHMPYLHIDHECRIGTPFVSIFFIFTDQWPPWVAKRLFTKPQKTAKLQLVEKARNPQFCKTKSN